MEIEMKMPDLGTTEDEITLIGWLVDVGRPVRRGEPLLEVETDKAAMEVESFATGLLKEIRAEPGDEVAAGQVIAIIEAEGAAAAPAPAPAVAKDKPAAPAAGPQTAAAPKKGGGMFARNRQAAEQAGGEQLSPVQRTVARRMQQSKQAIPHFYLQAFADAEAMIAYRKAAAPKKIAWDAFFVRAAALALKRFERMGFRFEEGKLVSRQTDAIGVAIDLDGDLYVTAIAGAASKTLADISDEIRTAADRLRAGDPKAKALRPANITITNLGACNVETFTAIINPPESAVLAIGKVAPAPVVVDGQIVARNRAVLTLSVDHRVVSGKYAAEFLDAIVDELQTTGERL